MMENDDTEIGYFTDFRALRPKVEELINYIMISYNLSEPTPDFIGHFASILKRYYGKLTFEKLRDAYERNSMGLLNEFLPRSGYAPDNKIKVFNIPELTKVINAYMLLRGLKLPKFRKENSFTPDQITQIRKQYFKELNDVFENYRYRKERGLIMTPLYTCFYLSKLGVLDQSKIDVSESPINLNFLGDLPKRLKNIELIYLSFDELISNNQTLMEFI